MLNERIGKTGSLQFDLIWKRDDARTVEEATDGALRVLVGEIPVWFGTDEFTGVQWSWDGLLEHVASFWGRLWVEEAYPLNLDPDSPADLIKLAEERWEGLPSSKRDQEEDRLFEYSLIHDLSHACRGIELPSLWLMKEGNSIWIDWGGRRSRRLLPLLPTQQSLAALAECILRRISHLTDERANYLRSAWQSRTRTLSDASLLRVVTGLDASYLRELAPLVGSESQSQSKQLDILLAAARMAGRIASPDVIHRIMERTKSVPQVDVAQLDALSEEAANKLAEVEHEIPFGQGYHLAVWMRHKLDIVGREKRVYPDRILAKWGISVDKIDLGDYTDELDAFAVWSKSHGPQIIINQKSNRSNSPGGRNFTLAHEICHLLVDRMTSLPLIEVLGGRVPEVPEKRANAFAAELLLPRRLAVEALEDDTGIQQGVRRTANSFGVSDELVAWQILNHPSVELTAQQNRFLRSLTHSRKFYPHTAV
jgi:Zn-dependent peptidase ImmA (M78 family)